jgi:hypothetical protein
MDGMWFFILNKHYVWICVFELINSKCPLKLNYTLTCVLGCPEIGLCEVFIYLFHISCIEMETKETGFTHNTFYSLFGYKPQKPANNLLLTYLIGWDFSFLSSILKQPHHPHSMPLPQPHLHGRTQCLHQSPLC